MTQRDTGWPKEIQGDSKGYSVTQWDTGWLSETQGDPKIYMMTQRATGWLNEIQGNPKRYRVTQWDTGWPKKIQGDSYSKRVTLWGTGWHNKATNWCNFVCLCGEIHASWHASMACYSFKIFQRNLICFKIFQASQAEEFDLLWMTNGSGIGVQSRRAVLASESLYCTELN